MSATYCQKSGAPPRGFPQQVSFGFLTKFADAAFELQESKGGSCPLAHELLQLVDPAEPTLLCLTALHAKSKTIITVSDGISWCRIASTQLPPVPPQSLSGNSGVSVAPDEETLNAAASNLCGCVIRLSQISITRTPRGKHIILCRAFQVLSRDFRQAAEAIQAQQKPEIAFPVWTEATAAATNVQQRPLSQYPQQQQQSVPQQQKNSLQQQQKVYPQHQPSSVFYQQPQQLHQPVQQQPSTQTIQKQAVQPPPQPIQKQSVQPPLSMQKQQQQPPPQPVQKQQSFQPPQQHMQKPIQPVQQQLHIQQKQQQRVQSGISGCLPQTTSNNAAAPPDQASIASESHHQHHHTTKIQQQSIQNQQQSIQNQQQSIQNQQQSIQNQQQSIHHNQQGFLYGNRQHQQQQLQHLDPQQQQPQQSNRFGASNKKPQEQQRILPNRPQPQQQHEFQQQQPQQQYGGLNAGASFGHLFDSHLDAGGKVSGGGAAAKTGEGGPQRQQQSTLSNFRAAPYPVPRHQHQGQHGVRPAGSEAFIPIKDLTAYVAKWTIKARVDVKGEIRKYNNARGPGQLFNVELKDKDGEIRATFFNAAVDRWYNVLQEGRVYYFRGGLVKPKNPRFNSTRHNYELTFDEKSSIVETMDEGDIPTSSTADLVDIKQIEQSEEVNSTVSVMAILHEFRPIQAVTLKSTGQQKSKRDVFLVDENGVSLALTLWGEKAKDLTDEQLSQKPVVLFKNVKVGDWNGKKLDSQGSTRIEVFPDNERAAALQDWWTREGSQAGNFFAASNSSGAAVGRNEPLKTLEEIGREAAQADPSILADKGVYFSCAALLERVADERFSWPACPECRKKTVETMASSWACSNCSKQFEQPNHTYLLSVLLLDVSGSLRCNCMGSRAEELMGNVKAEVLLLLQDESVEQQVLDSEGRSFSDVFGDVNLEEWIFRICSKNDSYMDEMRMKHRIVAAAPLFRRVADQTQQRLDFIRSTFARFDIPVA